MSTTNRIAEGLLAEFEAELKTTRRFLECISESSLTWKPHERSMTAGQLGLHIADVPRAVLMLSLQDEAAPPDFKGGPPHPRSASQIAAVLDETARYVRATLPTIGDDRMLAEFKIVVNGKTLMTMPRFVFLRAIMFNHLYHHRGQFGVYLRLMGQRVPSSYGPSGDEELAM